MSGHPMEQRACFNGGISSKTLPWPEQYRAVAAGGSDYTASSETFTATFPSAALGLRLGLAGGRFGRADDHGKSPKGQIFFQATVFDQQLVTDLHEEVQGGPFGFHVLTFRHAQDLVPLQAQSLEPGFQSLDLVMQRPGEIVGMFQVRPRFRFHTGRPRGIAFLRANAAGQSHNPIGISWHINTYGSSTHIVLPFCAYYLIDPN